MPQFKLTLLFTLLAFAGFAQNEWELKKDQDGIKVYTKHVEGSGLKAIKATTTFNFPVQNCISALKDIEHLTELYPDCYDSKTIEQSELFQIHYLGLSAPWPVSDRDATFSMTYEFEESTHSILVKTETVTGKYPVQKGVVRLTKGGGYWRLTIIDANTTELDYFYHGEPGGNIPAWLANSVVENNPLRMLKNLKTLASLERNMNKRYSFIQ